MKQIHFLILTSLLSNSLTAQDDVYENVAQEMCGCVSKYDDKLSPAIKDVFIRASLDMENSDEILAEYFEKNLEQGVKDLDELEKFTDGVEDCMTVLEEKYSEIYVNEAGNKIELKLLTILENKADCKFTAAIIRIGLSAEEDEGYYDEETE